MKDKIRPFVNCWSDKLLSFFRFPILILKIISGYISKMVSHSRKSLSALDHGNEAERICWPADGSENFHPSPIINTVAVYSIFGRNYLFAYKCYPGAFYRFSGSCFEYPAGILISELYKHSFAPVTR